MILLDTSGVLAWIDSAQKGHQETRSAMEAIEGPYFLSPFVLAELDYLLATRVGTHAQEKLLEEVARGAFLLELFEASDIRTSISVLETYRDFGIGLADASIVVLAERRSCGQVLTLDERHFRVLRTPKGAPFRLLPADTYLS